MRRLSLILLSVALIISIATYPGTVQASSYSQVILFSQPERYYRLDESTGSSANDSAHGWVGTYNTATLGAAGATYDGNAAVYLPATAFVSFPVYAPYGKSYAFEYWARFPSGATNNTSKSMIYMFGSETIRHQVVYTTAAGYVLSYVHLSATTVTTLSPDTWYYVVGQFNRLTSRVEIYLNGTLIYSAGDTPWATQGTASLRSGDAGNQLPAYMDEFALYDNRVLSQDEIALHYAAGFAAYNTPTPTVTSTPSVTLTPTVTPTPTLPASVTGEVSGASYRVDYSFTTGEIVIALQFFVLIAIVLFAIFLRRRR